MRTDREVGGAVAHRQQVPFADVDPPLTCDGDDAAGFERGCDPTSGLSKIALLGLVWESRSRSTP